MMIHYRDHEGDWLVNTDTGIGTSIGTEEGGTRIKRFDPKSFRNQMPGRPARRDDQPSL